MHDPVVSSFTEAAAQALLAQVVYLLHKHGEHIIMVVLNLKPTAILRVVSSNLNQAKSM